MGSNPISPEIVSVITFLQLTRQNRKKKRKKIKFPVLEKCPQKRAYCIKLFIMKPKKPNSARRRVVKLHILKSGRYFVGYIPGNVHTLQEFSNVLIRGGRVRDLPGIRYKLIRGVLDFDPLKVRRKSRSKYGTNWWWRVAPPVKAVRKSEYKDNVQGFLNECIAFDKFEINKSEILFRENNKLRKQNLLNFIKLNRKNKFLFKNFSSN